MADDVNIVVRVDDSTRAGVTAVNASLTRLTRDAEGRLRDMSGRFAASSSAMTGAIGQVTGALQGGGSAGGGAGGMGLNPAMMGVAGVAAASLLPALGALSPILFGVAAAGGAAGLAMGAIKEEAKKLKPQFESLQKAAEKAVMPGVAKGFKELQGAMKGLHPVVREGGRAFGDFVAKAGAFANSPAFQGALLKNVQMGTGFFDKFSGSILTLTQSFLDFGAKSQSSLNALTSGLSGLLSQGLPGMFKGLERGIQGSAQMLGGFFDMLNAKLLPALGRFAGEAARSLGPVFGETLRLMGTMTAGLLDGLGGALKAMSPIFKDVSHGIRGLNQLISLTAPIIKDTSMAIVGAFLPSFAEVDKARGPFRRLADAIERNKIQIQQTALMIGNAFIDMVSTGVNALPGLVGGFRVMTSGIMVALQVIVDSAAAAFKWIPGIGGKLEDAQASFRKFRDGWNEGLASAEQKTRDFANKVTPKLQRNKLLLNIKNWESMIATAEREMRATTNKERKAKLKADIAQLQRAVAQAKGELASVRGKTVVITTVHRRLEESVQGQLWKASGGIIGAAGGGPRSRMTLVGEQGPELVDLAPGSTVRSNPDTRRMMAGGGGGGEPIIVNLIVDGETLARAMIDPLRKQIRHRGGGDVQRALGR